MTIRKKIINFVFKIATGSHKTRNLITPVGVIFFFTFITLSVVAAFKVDSLLLLPKISYHPWDTILAVLLIMPGLSLMLWSIYRFFKVRGTPVPLNPPPKLVTDGPYAYTRNPMLSGLFIFLFGIGVWFNSVSLLFIFVPLLISLAVTEIKTIEEPELIKRFGKKYRDYRRRTPMLFPRFRKK